MDRDGQVLRSLKIMDPTLLFPAGNDPAETSSLETHREQIRQLLRKGCTYRDIVRILHEQRFIDRRSIASMPAS